MAWIIWLCYLALCANQIARSFPVLLFEKTHFQSDKTELMVFTVAHSYRFGILCVFKRFSDTHFAKPNWLKTIEGKGTNQIHYLFIQFARLFAFFLFNLASRLKLKLTNYGKLLNYNLLGLMVLCARTTGLLSINFRFEELGGENSKQINKNWPEPGSKICALCSQQDDVVYRILVCTHIWHWFMCGVRLSISHCRWITQRLYWIFWRNNFIKKIKLPKPINVNWMCTWTWWPRPSMIA